MNGTNIQAIGRESKRSVSADSHKDDSWVVIVCAEWRRAISSPPISPLRWIFQL
jgi:hypothetical protein